MLTIVFGDGDFFRLGLSECIEEALRLAAADLRDIETKNQDRASEWVGNHSEPAPIWESRALGIPGSDRLPGSPEFTTPGTPGIWDSGICEFGYPKIRRSGNLEIPGSGNLRIQKSGNLRSRVQDSRDQGIWESRYLGIPGSGNLAIPESGNLAIPESEISGSGNLRIRISGNLGIHT